MDFNIYLTIAMIWGMAVITPGPNFFITIHTSVAAEQNISLFSVIGIIVGTFIWSLSGFLGISLLFKTVPVLYFYLKLIGGIYLIYIGFNFILKKRDHYNSQKVREYSALNCFRLGILTNLLNPKTAIFMTSLFAATIPQSATFAQGTFCVFMICSISAIWYSIVALIFRHNFIKQLYYKQKHIVEKIAGTIFIGFGVKLVISK